jgi:hypothetical protein
LRENPVVRCAGGDIRVLVGRLFFTKRSGFFCAVRALRENPVA